MTAPLRVAAKLAMIVQIPVALACSSAGPGGPGESADAARFAGVLTVSEGSADATAGQAFRAAAPLAGAHMEFVSQRGNAVATANTSGTGSFSSALPSGVYTVRIAMREGPPLEYSLDLPPGEALFAEGRVDRTPSGLFSMNVQVFRDRNADARPDDSFRVQILDRVQGDGGSGVQDVVATPAEAAEMVTLCHAPPGNPANAHTIEVGASALPAHLAHGDTEGACDGDTGPVDDDETGTDEGDEDSEEAQVLVCHVPSGNPENAHTIEVGESSLSAHLAHGDTEGECPDPDAEEPESGESDGG